MEAADHSFVGAWSAPSSPSTVVTCWVADSDWDDTGPPLGSDSDLDSNAEDHVQGQVPGPGPIVDPDTASDTDFDATSIADFAQEYTSLAGHGGIGKRLEPGYNEDLSRRSVLGLVHRSDAKSDTSFSADAGLEEAFRSLVDKQNHVRADPWDDIPDWLMSDSGIYRVCGKPGSGKSRLMRYLAEDEDMRRLATSGCPEDMRFIICRYSVDGKAWERHG